MSKIQTMEELTSFLTSQHEDLKQLLPKVLDASGAERGELFTRVRRTLAVHEALEQATVHIAAKQEPDEDPGERLEEEAEAEQAFTQLEGIDIDSDEFVDGFTHLQGDIVDHAENEEHKEFEGLHGELSDVARARVATALDLFAQVEEGTLPGDTFEVMLDGAKHAILQPDT